MDINDYQKQAATTAIYPTIETIALGSFVSDLEAIGVSLEKYQIDALAESASNGSNVYYPTIGLSGEAGEVANKVKKIIRDCNGIIDEPAREGIKGEIGGVLWYLAAVCTELDFDMSDVAQSNLDALFSRKERGVLKGSGDNR